MQVLIPLKITDSLLNFPTDGVAVWAPGDYDPGDVVQSLGVIYTRLGGSPGTAADWISDTDYAVGDRARSLLGGGSFINNAAGISTVDPSLDPGRWLSFGVAPPKYFPNIWQPSPHCNAAEPAVPAPAWVTDANYAIDAVVSVTAQHMQYTRIAGETLEDCIIGAPYVAEEVRLSPANGYAYKCIADVAVATEPSTDATHWIDLRKVSPEDNLTQWAEADPVERIWIRDATYEFWDQVILTSTHRKYRRKVAGAGTKPPNLDTTNWQDDGPTNRHACFDPYCNTPTVLKSPLTVVIAPKKRVSVIYLTGLKATSATVTQTVNGVVKYSQTHKMLQRKTTSWSTYFFGSFRYRPVLALGNIPVYTDGVITVTLTNTRGNVELGDIGVGMPVWMGDAQLGAVADALNFSETDRDAFGKVTLIPRRTVPKTDQKTIIDSKFVDLMFDLRNDANAVPCFYSTLDDNNTNPYFRAFLIKGFYRSFSITAGQQLTAEVATNVEEI